MADALDPKRLTPAICGFGAVLPHIGFPPRQGGPIQVCQPNVGINAEIKYVRACLSLDHAGRASANAKRALVGGIAQRVYYRSPGIGFRAYRSALLIDPHPLILAKHGVQDSGCIYLGACCQLCSQVEGTRTFNPLRVIRKCVQGQLGCESEQRHAGQGAKSVRRLTQVGRCRGVFWNGMLYDRPSYLI